jgi:hypothetical protein
VKIMLLILTGKKGSDTRGEHTFVNQLSSSVIDYALVMESIIRNVIDFRTEVGIIGNHIPILLELLKVTVVEKLVLHDRHRQTE